MSQKDHFKHTDSTLTWGCQSKDENVELCPCGSKKSFATCHGAPCECGSGKPKYKCHHADEI